MSDTMRTVRALAAMTDPGKFERLVTAVLRAYDPVLYGNILHPGVNEDGKPVKSPVDGVGWVLNATGRCVVYAAHTTAQDK